MKRLLAVVGLVAVLAGAFLYVDETSPPWYERIRYPLRYSEFVRVHAREHGLDPALLAAVIYQESKFQAERQVVLGRDRLDAADADDGEGHRVAHGRARVPYDDLYDPEINIRYGAWYLDNLFKKYGDEQLVLAAYNAGQGNVDRWRANVQPIQFAETRAYVERVEDLKSIYRSAWRSKLYPQN